MNTRNPYPTDQQFQHDPDPKYPKIIEVTCVVGEVILDVNGDVPMHVAAFEMIARHGAEGTFKFPMVDRDGFADGRVCSIDVRFEGEL